MSSVAKTVESSIGLPSEGLVRICQRCKGKGKVWPVGGLRLDQDGKPIRDRIPCWACGGQGKIDRVRHLELVALEYMRLRESLAEVADYARSVAFVLRGTRPERFLSLIEHALVENVTRFDPKFPERSFLPH